MAKKMIFWCLAVISSIMNEGVRGKGKKGGGDRKQQQLRIIKGEPVSRASQRSDITKGIPAHL